MRAPGRRLSIILLVGPWISLPGIAIPEETRITALVGEEAFGAFTTAIGEDRSGASPIQLTVIRMDDNGTAKSSIAGARPRAVVAFGSRAFEAIAASDPAVPLIVTMVLTADGGRRMTADG